MLAARLHRAVALPAAAAGRRLLGGSPFSAIGEGTGEAGATREGGADVVGSLAAGRTVVQPSLPNQALPDPAADDAPSLVQRLTEKAEDMLRPAFARGHAYHYAEDSARAVLREQQATGRGVPGVEEMWAPPEVAGADGITAPKAWHFSNRSNQLDEEQQARVAAQNPGVK